MASSAKPIEMQPVAGGSPENTQAAEKRSRVAQEQDVQSLVGSNDAKDKTQVASTTSMAVIHVGILKAILDLGSDGLSYYDWCLGFVITALILQFISGIIAIYIAMMKSFLSQFKYDFNYYCTRCMCPCIFKSKPRMDISAIGVDEEPGAGETSSLVDPEEPQESGSCVCCLCCQEAYDADDVEYPEMLIDTYIAWQGKNLRMQLKTANIADDIAATEQFIADLQEARKTALEDESDLNKPKLEDIDQRIDQQQKQLLQLKTVQHESQVLQHKGDVLISQIKTTMNQKVMKKAAFWQCILTILTYIIFALNTVITGFGLSNLAKSEV